MAIGNSILSLLGNSDPRQQLLQSILNGTGGDGAQYAAQPSTPAPTDTAGVGGTTTPPAAVPEGMKSPPDLASMYGEMVKYEARARNIDRGFGLIGSAVSQDGNREATLNAFTGGGGSNAGGPTPTDIITIAQGLQKNRLAQMTRAAQLAALPQIAARYGLDPATARMMFESGGLDEIIKNAEKPDRVTMAGGDGRLVTVNQRIGEAIGDPIGPAKPRATRSFQDANGQQRTIYEDTGEEVSPNSAVGPMKVPDPTSDDKEWQAAFDDHIQRGLPADTFPSKQEWFNRQSKNRGTNIDMKAEGAEQGKIGEYWGKQYTGIQEQGQAALANLQNYDLIEKGLESGIRTGSFGEGELAVRKFAQSIGIADADDDKKVAGGELMQKITNRMALLMRNPESGMGMPGSLSDKDLAFLKDSMIGLNTSKGGNKLALEVFRRLEDRKLQIAAEADKWVNGEGKGSMRGFSQYLRQWNKENPLFDDIKVDNFVDQDPEARRKAVLEKYKVR